MRPLCNQDWQIYLRHYKQYYQQLQQLMINLIQEIDFDKDLSQEPELRSYFKQAAKLVQKQEYDQLIKFKKPVFDENLENHLIVTNIPDLKGKEDKFIPFFKSFLEKKGIGVKEGLESLEPGYTELNGDKKYNKTLYMIYKSAGITKKAYQKLHQLKFDKQHTLACFTVREFREVAKLAKQYKEPIVPDHMALIAHNTDEKYRDQFIFAIKEGNSFRLVLKWFDHIEKKVEQVIPDSVSSILKEGTSNVVFSAKGLYIAVCEKEGVRLLYGKDLSEKGFYRHEGASDVQFSPSQSYMITHNKQLGASGSQESYILWAVQPEIKMQELKAQSHQSLASFQFNKDETKLAIVLTNQFVVYNCQSVDALKKQLRLSEEQLEKEGRIVKAQHLQKIAWLPDGVSLTCVCYEINPTINSHPTSKIFTYNTENKEEKKWRAIGQHIKRAQITMSQNGDWVAVSFKKIQKKNLSITVIYIVNLLKREIETDVVEFKQNVVNISWDCQNGRFGAVHEISAAVKNDDIRFGVTFHQIHVKDKVQQAIKFAEILQTPANRIILSQNGAFFALYNVSTYSWGKYKYTLGAFVKDVNTKKMSIEIIKQNIQISYMTYFDMDSSGRFFLAGTDKTYQIWTTSGELISKDSYNTEIKFVHFRPRYMLKLSSEGEAKLEDRQKEIRKKYQDEDERRQNALEYEKRKEKEEKKNSFKKYLEDRKMWFEKLKQSRNVLRGFSEDDPKVKSSTYQFKYYERS